MLGKLLISLSTTSAFPPQLIPLMTIVPISHLVHKAISATYLADGDTAERLRTRTPLLEANKANNFAPQSTSVQNLAEQQAEHVESFHTYGARLNDFRKLLMDVNEPTNDANLESLKSAKKRREESGVS